ncbi:MAG: rhodanese-like domain-containing protein [Thermodesulfobacteriota bacterium]
MKTEAKGLISSVELNNHLKSNTDLTVIDVRSSWEYKAGHIPGAIHIPFWASLSRHGRIESDPETPMVLTCAHGPRAILAKLIYSLLGFKEIFLLAGHMKGWQKMDLPLAKP